MTFLLRIEGRTKPAGDILKLSVKSEKLWKWSERRKEGRPTRIYFELPAPEHDNTPMIAANVDIDKAIAKSVH